MTGSSRDFIDWARNSAINLEIPESEDDVHLFDRIAPLIGDKSIIALGENAHYLHEWNHLRTRLFQYLVKEHGFSVFVLESGFVEGKIVHDYVNGADIAWERVIDAITNAWGVWSELQELITWMRAYNDGKSDRQKLKFYCMDGSGNWSHAKITYAALHRYLITVSANLAAEFAATFEDAVKKASFETRLEIDRVEWQHLGYEASRLISRLEQSRVEFSAAGSRDAFEWALRYAFILRDQLHCWAETEEDFSIGFKTFWNIRDAAMADQLEWIIEREGPVARFLIGAHNNHLQQFPVRVQQATSMGSYLTQRIGRERTLFICATSGKSAKGDLPIPDSNQAAYNDIGIDRFVLDLRDAPKSGPVHNWLKSPRMDRSNLRFQPVAPGIAWDLLVFLSDVTIAHVDVPPALGPTRGEEIPAAYPALTGRYLIDGFLAAVNTLDITFEDGVLCADGSDDTSGELFPPFEVPLQRTEDGRFIWPNWPAVLELRADETAQIVMPGMGVYDGRRVSRTTEP